MERGIEASETWIEKLEKWVEELGTNTQQGVKAEVKEEPGEDEPAKEKKQVPGEGKPAAKPQRGSACEGS